MGTAKNEPKILKELSPEIDKLTFIHLIVHQSAGKRLKGKAMQKLGTLLHF